MLLNTWWKILWPKVSRAKGSSTPSIEVSRVMVKVLSIKHATNKTTFYDPALVRVPCCWRHLMKPMAKTVFTDRRKMSPLLPLHVWIWFFTDRKPSFRTPYLQIKWCTRVSKITNSKKRITQAWLSNSLKVRHFCLNKFNLPFMVKSESFYKEIFVLLKNVFLSLKTGNVLQRINDIDIKHNKKATMW